MPQAEYPAVGRGYDETYRLPTAGLFTPQFSLSSHFGLPNGRPVWLATNIKCLTAFPTYIAK
ncbi:MAG: hypothetical protein IJL54_09890 [Prevotella sp.]|nr:hypothetical protein [Prevotella sp.]